MSGFKKIATTHERLKSALTNANMKQVELIQKTGLDKGAVSCYLSGKYEPKADAINKMAAVLNVSDMWLMGYDVPMERETTPPESITLTEGESMLLELFRLVPEESQQMVLDMIKIALRQNQ